MYNKLVKNKKILNYRSNYYTNNLKVIITVINTV